MLKVEEYAARDVESLRLGRDADKLAVIVDPAGYCWEILERHERQVTEPLCKVCSGLVSWLQTLRVKQHDRQVSQLCEK